MKKSISQLKKELWKLVSIFVRTRYADEWGNVECVTCPRILHWKKVDAGHFLPGRMNSILFDVRGIHPQCKPCNGGLRWGGLVNAEVSETYRTWMLKNQGEDVVKDLERLRRTTRSFTPRELEEMIEFYKPMVKMYQ